MLLLKTAKAFTQSTSKYSQIKIDATILKKKNLEEGFYKTTFFKISD